MVRQGQHEILKMLCFLCRKIQIKSAISQWSLQHHLTFADLTEAADDGCELCQLFRATTLNYYAEKHSVSHDAAEDFHCELDDDGLGEVEADRQVFYVELKAIYIDERFGPCPRGAYGLIYVRQPPGDDHMPARDVYPFVEFSVQAGTITFDTRAYITDRILDSDAAIGGWIVGREVAQTPDFSLAKKWIQECSEKHMECDHTLHFQLPPRVIDVGPPNGSEMPRLVLRGGVYWGYATLSDCWGGSKPMITDSTTIKANMEGIPYNTLPKTFQDAVTTTRQLGLRYL